MVETSKAHHSAPAWATLPALLLAALLFVLAGPVRAQDEPTTPAPDDSVAQVRLDGKVLFRLRGISAYPAARRARLVEDRIKALAKNPAVSMDALTFRQENDHFDIAAGDRLLLKLYPLDAELENVNLPLLAEVVRGRIAEAVDKYRADRSPDALRRSAMLTVGLTVALVVLLWVLARLRRWLERAVRTRVEAGMESLERKSGSVVQRGHLWSLAQGLLQALWILSLLVIAYFYLSSVLGTFPWTRGVALVLLDYVKTPLESMGQALVNAIPDLMFLTVLWFVVRYLLKTLHAFFLAVQRGRVRLTNFERDWAMPTYRLLRVAILAFSLVVAYPYIPGSDSGAFKGVSLFLGVIVSLGSTSFISNLIAGIALTYRGVFRVGDWVTIGDAEGRVEEIRSQVVRLRTRDNERVSIPSSTILNADVTNLSEQSDGQGLVLRIRIGLGYDVSWKQAEGLLLEAAQGIDGVRDEPAPFVLVNDLGDYAVLYTLVVRVVEPGPLPLIRTHLNRAVLDRFHAAGVQIMSPAYVADPAAPKIPSTTDRQD